VAARRGLLIGGAGLLAVGGGGLLMERLAGRPCFQRNPAQKAFLDDLQALARPALGSQNPLAVQEAVKQTLALAERQAAFSDWCATLRKIEGNDRNVAVTFEIGPQVSLYAFNDWALSTAGSLLDKILGTKKEAPPPGLTDAAITALKAMRLGETVMLAGRFGEIAGSALADLGKLLGRSETESRQFLQTPRFLARIDAIAPPPRV